MRFRRKPKPAAPTREARQKRCDHYARVSAVCDQVLRGDVPPSDLGTEVLAEEYLDLHLEYQALLTHLGIE